MYVLALLEQEEKIVPFGFYIMPLTKEAPMFSWTSFSDVIKAIVLAIISAACTYFAARRSTRRATFLKALEQQLTKVFAPIHQIYCFVLPTDRKGAFAKIQDIINENIAIVPAAMLHTWLSDIAPLLSQEQTPSESADVFFVYNKACFESAQQELGYAKRKWGRASRKTANKILAKPKLNIMNYITPIVIIGTTAFVCFFDSPDGPFLSLWIKSLKLDVNIFFIAGYILLGIGILLVLCLFLRIYWEEKKKDKNK